MQKDSGITKAGAESNKSAETVDSRAHEEKSTDPDSSWIVQSSTKPRRLVPQHTLTRQELGMDNNRPRSTPAEPTKRKGIVVSI